MVLKAKAQEKMARAHALTIWAAARERAIDELARRAAQSSSEGEKNEAVRLREAARLLRLRAIQERALRESIPVVPRLMSELMKNEDPIVIHHSSQRQAI